MRVLILVDARFAVHERALIERVVIGLADEGIMAQVVLPKDRNLEDAGFNLIREPVWYADRGLSLTQRIRATQIAKQVTKDQLSKDAESFEGVIDIVHVFGGGAWSMGRELAKILGAGVIFEVWRAGLVDSAASLQLDESDNAMFLVPERSFESSLMSKGLAHRVHVAPWGAQVPSSPNQILRDDKQRAIVIMSSGRQKDQCIAAFDGVADAIELDEHTDSVMVFANLEVVQRAGLWARVKERKLENRFTIIDRSEDRRDLVLRCDIMIYPDTLHEQRTLLLDAMGAGMAIIAGKDESISPLQDSPGVLVVDRPSRADWATLLRACLADTSYARNVGLASRAYVTKNRRAAMYVMSVMDAYHALCGIDSPVDGS